MINLRILREEQNLSQQKLADQFELAQSQIHYFETGKFEPDLTTLNKYADYFGVSVDYLLGRTEIRQVAAPLSKDEINEEEQAFLSRFRKYLPHQKQSLSMFMDTLGAR